MKKYLDPTCHSGEFFKTLINEYNVDPKDCIGICRSKREYRTTLANINTHNLKIPKGNIFISEAETIKDWSEFGIMESDDVKVITNPPFNNGAKDGSNLYIKIIGNIDIMPHADKMIVLCPGNGFYNTKNMRVKRELEKHFESFEKISDNGFDASFDKDLYILTFNKNCTNPLKFEDIRFSVYDNESLARSIYNKFNDYKSSVKVESYENQTNYKFNVYVPQARGNRDQKTGGLKWDWTTVFPPEIKYEFDSYKGNVTDPKKRVHIIGFNTKEECTNFVNYLDSDISMFAIHLLKMNKGVNLNLVPYMPTYTKSWTDDEIAKEIGLTKEEVDYIHKEMKDFGYKAQFKK